MAGRERTDDDIKFIELVLHLFKNLLVVPDAKLKEASGGDNLSHMHDDLIVAFDQENVLEMLLIMTQVCCLLCASAAALCLCCCSVPLLLLCPSAADVARLAVAADALCDWRFE